jgi:hypothetical protein
MFKPKIYNALNTEPELHECDFEREGNQHLLKTICLSNNKKMTEIQLP